MSFTWGLIAGLSIAALQVAAARSGLEYGPFEARRDGRLAVLVLLVPLGILWGWTWVSERWSGRSNPRMVGYTTAFVFGAALAPVVDRLDLTDLPALASEPTLETVLADLPETLGPALAFLVPAVAVAAVPFWLFASGRLPARKLPLALGYLVGLPFAIAYPPVAIGAVGGTAAGHSWRSPGSQTAIAALVVILLVAATFAPAVLAALGLAISVPMPSLGR